MVVRLLGMAGIFILSMAISAHASARDTTTSTIQKGGLPNPDNTWPVLVDSLIRSEDYRTAEKYLKTLLKNKKAEKTNIWLALGKLKTRQEAWPEAKDWFSRIIQVDPENLEGLYFIGICQREIGKEHATLPRMLIWRDSEKKFKLVLAADSTFKDVYYQYALLEDYRRRHTEAILKCKKQLIIKPEDEETNVGIYFLHRAFLLHKSFTEVESWLKAHLGDFSDFYLAELYRQRSLFNRSDSIYQTLLSKKRGMSAIPVYLALLRQELTLGHIATAANLYWRANDAIADSLDARLMFEDIKYICKDDEVSAFQKLLNPIQWQSFFREFWQKRNPMPAAAYNFRLVEHYRRMFFAEKSFRYDRFRTWHFNPDRQKFLSFPKSYFLNKDFDDRGLIYIRHGPPHDKATAVRGITNISWLYYPAGGFEKMIFHFENIGEPGDWRLTPMTENEAAIEAMLMWDGAYVRYWRGDFTSRNFVRNDIALHRKQNVTTAMSSDRHSWPDSIKPMDIGFSIATFRSEDRETDLCELYLGFATRELLKNKPRDEMTSVNVGIAIHDTAWNELQRINETIELVPKNPSIIHDSYVMSFPFTLNPDKYQVSFFVDVVGSPYIGGIKLWAILPDYLQTRLLTSDIQLTYAMQPIDATRALSKKNMLFTANPWKTFRLNEPVFVYFEIYNLILDEYGQANFTITYTAEDQDKKKSGFLGLFGEKETPSLSLKTTGSAFVTTAIEHTVLDVSKLESGSKKLIVHIQDLNSGQSYETETVLQLTK